MTAAVLRFGRGIRWYLRELTGEAKWDRYLDHARIEGIEPMTRRDFERHRIEHQEKNPKASCC